MTAAAAAAAAAADVAGSMLARTHANSSTTTSAFDLTQHTLGRLLPCCCAVQVQSNALAALEAIDPAVADAVLREGCITGDRINGLCDGETGDW